MNIAIVSLDDSDLISVGGKHIHQQLLKRGLESKGHTIINFFPKKSMYFYFVRIIFYVLNKVGMSKATAYKWTLDTHCNNLTRLINTSTDNIELVYAQDPVAAVAASKSNVECNIVMTLHGYLAQESVNYGNYTLDEASKVLEYGLEYERASIEVVSSIISVDTRIKNYIIKDFDYKGTIRVLKNAIDPEKFNTTSIEKIKKLKSEFSLKTEKIILIPRRLVRKNGVDIAIDAMKKLGSRVQDFHMIIMGDGPEMNKLKNQVREALLDKFITFLGSVNYSDVAMYYDLSDIVMIPSVIRDGIEEATSLSMLEGLAAKKAVVVSNIGGMKEVIKNRKNGFSFEQGNVEELCSILQDIESMSAIDLENITLKGYKDVCKLHHYIRHTEEYLREA
ncbi:glycosyltransferase family 4 protein [Halobacteriovorax sp. DPLXC-1]|uniref:glycosyltransferase family 4 protein n=1 Tax=Halobacteriovorax sp. DPLXC-1 TaxID=3110771 RepID=UPI002FF11F80